MPYTVHPFGKKVSLFPISLSVPLEMKNVPFCEGTAVVVVSSSQVQGTTRVHRYALDPTFLLPSCTQQYAKKALFVPLHPARCASSGFPLLHSSRMDGHVTPRLHNPAGAAAVSLTTLQGWVCQIQGTNGGRATAVPDTQRNVQTKLYIRYTQCCIHRRCTQNEERGGKSASPHVHTFRLQQQLTETKKQGGGVFSRTPSEVPSDGLPRPIYISCRNDTPEPARGVP